MELQLNHIRPSFERIDTQSDIWNSSRSFLSSNKRYLVKAASGRGKTTLQKILHGTYRNYEGIVLVADKTLSDMDSDQIAKYRSEEMSFIFQDLRLFSDLTAMENVLIKNELTGLKSRDEILAFFSALDMADLIDRPCGEMSFGQQQRVAIIRALCQPFHFLVCDEPFSHLDDHNIDKACSLIEQELTDRQASLIMLSLDHGYSFSYSEQINL